MIPSRNCPFSRGILGGVDNSSLRISAKVKTGTRNNPALTTNTQPGPTQSMTRPEIAGPISRAELKAVELRATAFGSMRAGTSSETNACRTGLSKAPAVPPTNARMYTIHSSAEPESTRMPKTKPLRAVSVWVICRRWRRSSLSATTPAHAENSRIGANCRAVTMPSSRPPPSVSTVNTSQS